MAHIPGHVPSPITVQQFDFLAETQGINVALAAAEQSGGVTGTREVPTQVTIGGTEGTPGAKASLSGAGSG